MRYIIVSLLGGEVQSYHQELVKEISERFDVNFLAEQCVPTHFTLKDIFETEHIEELERVLQEFVQAHNSASISLQGFNRFEDSVIFMDIRPSQEAQILFEQFIEALRSIPWMQWTSHDGVNRKFHCSLAYFDIQDKYKDICRFLLKNRSYSFEAFFENIAVYRQSGEVWELYRSFCLKHKAD